MNQSAIYQLSILGCRGIPSKYGGFETFAQRLALYLTSQGWLVTVYCQDSESSELYKSSWKNINLVHIPAPDYGALSSIFFDWKSVAHASQNKNSLILTLGYNTAIFCLRYRIKNLVNIINMDGIEWRRQKWNAPQKAWLYMNEWLGSWLGNHLIADHPEIKNHLATRVNSEKITVIPYGTQEITEADVSLLDSYNLKPNEYALIIARAEPENNILEIVSAFSQKQRNINLVVLGNYKPDQCAYHKQVTESASDEVLFLGAIYDLAVTNALRFYTKLYIHGHSVGGTNPSLVEAIACSSPVLAHDNLFNRWVAGEKAHYFKDEEECLKELDNLLENEEEIKIMKQGSWQRHQEEFYETRDMEAYFKLLKEYIDKVKI